MIKLSTGLKWHKILCLLPLWVILGVNYYLRWSLVLGILRRAVVVCSGRCRDGLLPAGSVSRCILFVSFSLVNKPDSSSFVSVVGSTVVLRLCFVFVLSLCAVPATWSILVSNVVTVLWRSWGLAIFLVNVEGYMMAFCTPPVW